MKNNFENPNSEAAQSSEPTEWDSLKNTKREDSNKTASRETTAEQSRERDSEALLKEAKQKARKASGEKEKIEEPEIDEDAVREYAEQEKQKKEQALRRDAIEAVEDDDKFGESATATERDGRRIGFLLERIQRCEESLGEDLDSASKHYRGGSALSRIFAKAGKEKDRKSLIKYKRELQERYGISYDSYSKKQLERSASTMERNGETPGYRNWDHAISFEKLKLLTRGEMGAQIRKSLKKAGYEKLPTSMDDEDFTIHEVSEMAAHAERIYMGEDA